MTSAEHSHTLTRSVAERILSLKRSDETDSSFARRIGVSPQVVSNYRSGSNGASLEILAAVVRNTEASAHWLVTGDGSRFRVPDEARHAVVQAVESFASDAERLLRDLRARYRQDGESHGSA